VSWTNTQSHFFTSGFWDHDGPVWFLEPVVECATSTLRRGRCRRLRWGTSRWRRSETRWRARQSADKDPEEMRGRFKNWRKLMVFYLPPLLLLFAKHQWKLVEPSPFSFPRNSTTYLILNRPSTVCIPCKHFEAYKGIYNAKAVNSSLIINYTIALNVLGKINC